MSNLHPNVANWRDRELPVEEVVQKIKSNSNVFVHGAAMTPTVLIDAMCRRDDLSGIMLYHIHLDGEVAYAKPELAERFHSISLFTGAQLRGPIARGEADFVPIFLREIPRLFREGHVKLNVALLQLSRPDEHGWCTLGCSVDTALQASRSADIILAEVNLSAPRTIGQTAVHINDVAAFCVTDHPLHIHPPGTATDIEEAIGEHIAGLIEDGSTLQLGIGGIPDAVLRRLGNKHDLGIHTEMFSDGVIPLVEGGVITNRYKVVHPNRSTTSFMVGSQKLYDFVDNNLTVEFHPCDRTNNTFIISKNPKVVAVNSAIEIDLSGQVCADSIGPRIFSGIGGQMDFIHGAALTEGGKPIIALPSTAKSGQLSRIVPTLKNGAGVVTSRGHAHWIVTEYGAVNLFGKSLKQRGELLISIAHPDFRSELREEFRKLRNF